MIFQWGGGGGVNVGLFMHHQSTPPPLMAMRTQNSIQYGMSLHTEGGGGGGGGGIFYELLMALYFF